MIRDYSIEEIEFELFTLETPADVRREMEMAKLHDACKQYGITYSEHWITFMGRIGFAQIVAAKVSGREAKQLERDWLEGLGGENG